jgi:pimeloyl-ACP methyl ester carboxylesterase
MGEARSACVLSPAGFGNMREGRYARALLRSSRRVAQLTAGHAELVVGGPVRRTLGWSHLVARPWRIPADEAAGAVRNLARSPGFDAALEATRRIHFTAARPIEAPVTVAFGERDRLLLPRQSRNLAELPPDARVGRLPGVGHVPAAVDAQAVVALIAASTARAPLLAGP